MLALFVLLILIQRVVLDEGALDLLQVQLVELLQLVDLFQLHEEHFVGLDFLDHGDELFARLEVQREHLDVVQQVDHFVVLKEGVARLLHVHFEALVGAHDLVGVVVVAFLDQLSSVVVIIGQLLLRLVPQLHVRLQELHQLLVVEVAHSAYTVRPEVALQAFDAYSHTVELVLKLVDSLHLHFLVENLRWLPHHTRTPQLVQRALPSYFLLFVKIDVVGGLVLLGVNVFDDGFLLYRLRNLTLIMIVVVFAAITQIILMTWASRIINILTCSLVCLFLNLSELVKRIVLLLFFFKVVLAFFRSWRIWLIISNKCINLIYSLPGFIWLNFDQLRLDHDFSFDMIIIVFHHGHSNLKIRLHNFI